MPISRIWTSIGADRPKFSTWLIQITINEARMKFRKDRKSLYESIDDQRSDEDGDYLPKDFADWRDIPSEALQRKELREALKTAIEKDDDILTQFHDRKTIRKWLDDAKTVGKLFNAYRWFTKDFTPVRGKKKEPAKEGSVSIVFDNEQRIFGDYPEWDEITHRLQLLEAEINTP